MIPLEGIDVEGVPCLSVDLRREINPAISDDETVLWDAGKFRYALFGAHLEHPVAEIRTLILGSEVRIVWEALGRPGIIELSMEQVRAVLGDEAYAAQWRQFLGGLRG